MMNWEQAHREITHFMKYDAFGTGYIQEFYEQHADQLIELLKGLETPDATPELTPEPKPARKDWGIAWFSRNGVTGHCERCGQVRRVYKGYNGGVFTGATICGECQGPVLRGLA